MIISDARNKEVQLIWYGVKGEDSDLKTKYLEWLNDPEVTKSLASPVLFGSDKGPGFIEQSFERFTKSDCMGFFIKYMPDNTYIGTAKLDNISAHTKSAFDGIMIGDRDYQGRGISTITYKILLAYAFKELKLRKIHSGCNANNIPMIKTFERLGYTQEGRIRDADYIDNKFSDHLYFGIFKDEFLELKEIELTVVCE